MDSTSSDTYKAYEKALRDYNITIQTTSGSGSRGDWYIEDAYSKLCRAYSALSTEDKKNNPLPRQHSCSNDGLFGCPTGMATMGMTWM
jgi:hypothetical protein